MNAPFYKFGLFGDEASFIIAFIIGICFGFFLERAGFGSGRKLAAQFYLRDLSVLKVMFTAIITAMTGLYLLSRLGMVDLSLVYLVPTFLVPQAVGGLLLGFGFVIGGYCPGTSCVSAVTGRIDGMLYLAGMIAGLVGFAEFYPYLQNFAHMTPMGQITLPRLFNLPYGLLVFAAVLMALGAFMAGEWAEKKVGGKAPDPKGSLIGQPWRLTPVRVLAMGLLAFGLVAAVAGDPYRGSHTTIDTKDLSLRAAKGADSIQVTDLAGWIIQGRNDFKLVDLRSEKDFAAYHIPTSGNVPFASLTPDLAAHNEKIILCSDDGTEAAKAWFLLEAQGYRFVYSLDGGMRAWQDTVLFPKKVTGTDTAASEKQAQVAKYFGGAQQVEGAAVSTVAAPALPPPAPLAAPSAIGAKPQAAPQARKKKEGC
ncbi:MAG TPA: YeeE/YedE thiosulfate transporter family protein [Terracidiphilus sp.]|nr:YeeE/YedE thiosulfate transporter family protein [Terracidiphilus sp.]